MLKQGSLVARAKRAKYQYELILGLYVMEGWEKVVVNGMVLTCAVLIVRVLVSSILLNLFSTAWNVVHVLV
ncbi:hypothetical protein LPJ63_004819 [Coemansia sp. RSA 2711]|nr:hypothetical protein LPJ63_004819 [Coemansia sp. RSA 2711]